MSRDSTVGWVFHSRDTDNYQESSPLDCISLVPRGVNFQRLGQELTADWLGTAVDYKETFHSVCSLFLRVLMVLSAYLISPMRCGKTFLWTAHDQESGLTCPPGIYVQEIPPGGYQQDTDLETTSGSTVKSFCYRSWWTQRMIRCYTVNLSSLSP